MNKILDEILKYTLKKAISNPETPVLGIRNNK